MFDTEKDNLRTLPYFIDNTSFQIKSMFCSHGQAILSSMALYNNIYNEVFIIDEPESGISLLNQIRLSVYFNKNAENNGNQFIFMSHSLPIISSVENIYSLDDKKWISSFVYLNTILNNSKIIVI
jgi:predicted ATPase